MLGIDWLAVNAFSVVGDPLAQVLRGSPRTDVYAAYERIRAGGDLASSRLGLRAAVSRKTCEAILRDPRFGVRPIEGADTTPNRIDLAQGPLSGSFLELDPPQHTRLRRLTAPAFRPKLIREFAPVVEEVLTEIMDRLERRDRFDLMTELANTFPIAVISRLRRPRRGSTHFSKIGISVGQSLDGFRPVRQAQDPRRARVELELLFRRLAGERRPSPRDEVISLLARAEAGGELTPAIWLRPAGCPRGRIRDDEFDLIGTRVAALQHDPDSSRRLVQEPTLADTAVEENLGH